MLTDLRTRPATARGAGAGFVLVTLAVLAVTIWLDVSTDADGPGAQLAPGWGWGYAALGPLLAGLATVILVRDPRQGFGWALAWLGCFWALDGLSQSWVRFGIRAEAVLPGVNLALWFLNRVGAFLPVTLALLLLLFPTGRFVPGRWRAASWAAAGAMALGAALVVVAPVDGLPDVALPPGVDLDLGALPASPALAAVARPVTVVASLAGMVVAMATVVVRYLRSAGRERDRMRWLLWSVVAMALLIAATFLLELRAAQDVVVLLIMALPAVAMTIGIVDPALVSIEELLGRTVLWAGLAAVVVAVDLAGLWLLTTMLGERLDERQVVLTVLLLTALVYAPLRHRLSRWVRRLMLGARADRYDAVSGLAATLETTDEGGKQLAAVARAVADAFRVPFVSVEVERGGGERLTTSVGERPAETRSLPISYRGEAVGRLVLPARGLRSRLSPRDEELLGDLVRQAATAARSSRLAEELQASRERLVLAREEERRRIRRDLHDGLGPDLGGVVFQLESARLLVDRDPEQAKTQLRATATLVQDVVADVRRLVHDLRPPALDDRGLVGALTQQAERMSVAGPATTVTAPDPGLGALPAAVEVAAYRIVGEALTNVTRHARARTCEVRLEVADGALVVTVRDDGVGVPDDAESGVGLLSLHERAAELGGRADVSCPPDGGTLVRAVLPLEDR
ncbi:GAF domain-containing sensor histidine kinase [Ornithinimicrobium cerasi]|uniref:GAF domain-containing sensor histidine kinase n=1 Tax=Ornithinimicrobium cerasi TaxID=2248773 RepID=UPI00137AEDBD|nr:GAF domain-containing sensor histidine kinase [Ornithinimicrobium cerasi]